MAERPVQRRLQQLLEANRRYRDARAHPLNTSPALKAVQVWQARRLRDSFEDFLASERERPAAEFFLSDLYGDFDVSGRDHDVERVLPVMRRVLPERLLSAATDAIELAVLSHALDLRVAHHHQLQRATLDAQRYAEAYRAAGLRRLRARQIGLIVRVGLTLDRAVTTPMVGGLLRLSRAPARAAGLAELQSFLERGFSAFKALSGASAFVNEIARREQAVSQRLFSGDPDPFRRVR